MITLKFFGKNVQHSGICFQMVKTCLPNMIRKNYGHIVAVSSLAGLAGIPNIVPYSASKFAVAGKSNTCLELLQFVLHSEIIWDNLLKILKNIYCNYLSVFLFFFYLLPSRAHLNITFQVLWMLSAASSQKKIKESH